MDQSVCGVEENSDGSSPPHCTGRDGYRDQKTDSDADYQSGTVSGEPSCYPESEREEEWAEHLAMVFVCSLPGPGWRSLDSVPGICILRVT